MIEPRATALITGASSGIGAEFARQLAAREVNLVLVARTKGRLEDLAAELRAARPAITVTVIPADLSVMEAASALTGQVADAGLTVDLLVNSAGFGSYGPLADQDPGLVAREVQVNCGSLVALTTLLLPPMLARGRGGVLNVSSTSGFQPVPTLAVYAATKAFVLSFTEALWAETRGSGVRVLALCPGPTETGFFAAASADGRPFLTRGRQTPEQVVTVALKAFEAGRRPSVIPGALNRFMSTGYRILPRSVMVRLARLVV